MNPDRLCLALFFDVKLRVSMLPPKETGDLAFGSTTLLDQGRGGFMGFHDWLRTKSLPKQIVGVRFWPHEAECIPKELFGNRPYISAVADQKGLEVWFGSQLKFERGMSGDQSFGFNRVLISADKSRVVLVLDTYDLSPEEIQSVEAALRFETAVWT